MMAPPPRRRGNRSAPRPVSRTFLEPGDDTGPSCDDGGIDCPGIGLAQEANPPTVDAGGTFTGLVTVSNPNDCVLRPPRRAPPPRPTVR